MEQVYDKKAGIAHIDKNKIGMACFIASEIIFFGMLIIAYLYYYFSNNQAPNAKTSLDVGTTAFFSVFLLSSSLTIWLADRSLARSNQRGVVLWLVATVVLGLVFLVGQGMEYIKLFNENIMISRNTFSSSFFTLTGFHGLHVFGGLVALSILAGMAMFGLLRGPKSSAIETISLYWHFVDVVWIFIFTLVYLLA